MNNIIRFGIQASVLLKTKGKKKNKNWDDHSTNSGAKLLNGKYLWR
jgi:hypothetical protein